MDTTPCLSSDEVPTHAAAPQPRTRWAAGFDPACLAGAAPVLTEPSAPVRMAPRAPVACDVRIYHEEELECCSPAAAVPASRLMRELQSAVGPRQREGVVRAWLERLGFDAMGYYGTLPGAASGAAQRGYLASYGDAERARRYFAARLHTVDPRWSDACGSSLPLAWDLASVDERLAQESPCALRRLFARELHEGGCGSGVIVPVTGVAGVSLVTLDAVTPSRRWIDDRVLAEALHFALVLHHHLSLHLRLAPPADGLPRAVALLPATQQAVLDQLANGLTDRQIAERLRLSPHTVDYHLRQLRQRFSARNRVQLVSAAAQALRAA